MGDLSNIIGGLSCAVNESQSKGMFVVMRQMQIRTSLPLIDEYSLNAAGTSGIPGSFFCKSISRARMRQVTPADDQIPPLEVQIPIK